MKKISSAFRNTREFKRQPFSVRGHTHDNVPLAVADVAARDAIPTSTLYEGIIVYVVSDATTYQLRGGETVDDWVTLVDNDGVMSHGALSDIGTNAHSVIDSHLADSSLHFTQEAISIEEAQISDFGTYVSSEDLTSHTGDATIHFLQSAISIEISQISNFGSYAAASHTHSMEDITDLGTYISNVVEDLSPVLGANLDAGNFRISNINEILLNAKAPPTYANTTVWMDNIRNALAHYNEVTDLAVYLGQDTVMQVRNETGVTITAGQPVYIDSSVGNLTPMVILAKADANATLPVVGLASKDISNNTVGYITVAGKVAGLDTSAYTIGDEVYLDEATAGTLTGTAPATGHQIILGYVMYVHASAGIIQVTPASPVEQWILAADDLSTTRDLITTGTITVGAGAEVVNDTVVPQWNTAYGWGDHSAAGYITGYVVTESDVTAHEAALTILSSQVSGLVDWKSGTETGFDSSGIDDNSASTVFTLASTTATWATTTNSGFTHHHLGDAGNIYFSGGSSSSSGANLALYGNSSASLPGDILLRNNSDVLFRWDDSTGIMTFYTSNGTKVQALELNASQAATFAGSISATTAAFSGNVTITNNVPQIRFAEQDEGTDDKNWAVSANFEYFNIVLYDDAWSGAYTAWRIRRGVGELIDTHQFYTGAGTIALTLDSSQDATFAGDIIMPSGGGINFTDTHSNNTDVNTLDDYEEGSWTPALRGSTSDPSQSYLLQTGTYTKIGNTVFYRGSIIMAVSGISAGSGTAFIDGFPSGDVATLGGGTIHGGSNWLTTNSGIPSHSGMGGGTPELDLYVYKNDAGKVANYTAANAADVKNLTTLVFSGQYDV